MKRTTKERLGKIIAGVVVPVCLAGTLSMPWYFGVEDTGYLNPVKQREYIFNNIRRSLEISDTRRRKLMEKIEKFADKNGDGYLDFEEKSEVWKKMGYKGPFLKCNEYSSIQEIIESSIKCEKHFPRSDFKEILLKCEVPFKCESYFPQPGLDEVEKTYQSYKQKMESYKTF